MSIEKAEFEIMDFGLSPYGEILELQKQYLDALVINKKGKTGQRNEYLLIGEHPPVITSGRRGKEENILYSESNLNKLGIEVYRISRGGDVTYHCPGQMIAYPIIDLEFHNLRVKDYVGLLEESIILLLKKYGISGERIDNAPGVWVGKGSDRERKICAIGVKCTGFCTMHGLALNVNADLSGFSLINPCGFTDKGVTSMEIELSEKLDLQKVKEEFSDIFLSLIFPF